MRSVIFVVLILINCPQLYAQNLVMNPSFEQYIYCPSSHSQITMAKPWTHARKTVLDSRGVLVGDGSTDFFHKCAGSNLSNVPANGAGYQYARTRDGYAGFFVYNYNLHCCFPVIYREYLQGQFKHPLIASKKYLISFYVNLSYYVVPGLANNTAIANIGAYLSAFPIKQEDYPYIISNTTQDFGNIREVPQIVNPPDKIITDTLGWTEIKGIYTAQGGEKYITLGNFIDNEHTTYKFLSPPVVDDPALGYYYIDDVSVTACDELISLGPDTTLCAGESLFLNAYSPVSNYTYKWQDSTTTSYYQIDKPGIYWVEATSSQDCITRDTLIVKVAQPIINLGSDTTLCSWQTLQLDASAGNGPYLWSDGSKEPYLQIRQPGTYWVKAFSGTCQVIDSITVSFDSPLCGDNIPNVITPNGDGKNDTFVIKGLEKDQLEITIMNRFGKQVYGSTDYRNDWDGSGLPTGLYYYRIRNPINQKWVNGWVHILY